LSNDNGNKKTVDIEYRDYNVLRITRPLGKINS